MKRVLAGVWLLGLVGTVAAALGALTAAPPAPQGLSCWHDPEHDWYPSARVVRDGLGVRVARLDTAGRVLPVTEGFVVFGARIVGSRGTVRFRGDRLEIEGAPYRIADCGVDRTVPVRIHREDGEFFAEVGTARVSLGATSGTCLQAPPFSERLVSEVVCTHGTIAVFRRPHAIVVENLDGGTSATFAVAGIPVVTYDAPLPRLAHEPLRVVTPDGRVVLLAGAERDCVPTDPLSRSGAHFNCLGGRGDRIEAVGVRVEEGAVVVERRHDSGAIVTSRTMF